MLAIAALGLALAPTAVAVPAPEGLSVNLPPVGTLSVPSTSPPLEIPGVTLKIPGVITLGVPLNLSEPGIPVEEVKLKTELVDLPPTIGAGLPKLVAISGLGDTVGALSPGLQLSGGSTTVAAPLDKKAYGPPSPPDDDEICAPCRAPNQEGTAGIYGDFPANKID